MYLDKKTRRVLLNNGTSVVTVDDYVARILKNGELPPPHIRVEDGRDSLLMLEVHGLDVGCDVNGELHIPQVSHTTTAIHIDPCKYPRFESMIDEYGDKFIDRLAEEIEFFEKTNSELIYKLMDLIDKFKEDSVVWGVGRGSACASVLMYVIEVHDLDPIRFDIPFSELSKESASEY